MQSINEEKLQPIIIDFEELKSKKLNESYYSMMGAWIKMIIDNMFGTSFAGLNLQIRGTEREVRSFTNAVASEKKHIQTARDYGLNNPRTYKSRAILSKAVKGFEKATGLKWPFK
jgi:hypothetical protein